MIKIKGTAKAADLRASVLASALGVTVEQARAVGRGEAIEVESVNFELIEAGIVEEVKP